MQRLFLFLYQYRAFLLFVFLEVLSLWLLVNNNQYQGAAFFNSANHLAASIYETKMNISSYFDLKEVNLTLAEENARLRKQLSLGEEASLDSGNVVQTDSLMMDQFGFHTARVVNNSVRSFNNYITINKGSEDGIEPDMAVINSQGIVGKVKVTSKHFSTVISLLHPSLYVSSVIKSSGTLCTTKWDGRDPQIAKLLYVPRHLEIQPGDTVVTSGYNAIFPSGLMIGVIKNVSTEVDATSFYNIDIELSTDFAALSYVYVVKNNLKEEIDSLEQNTYIINEQ